MKKYQICTIVDCGRIIGKHGAKSLCPLHYRRLRVHGDPELTMFHKPCGVSGCPRTKTTKVGYCTKHYKRYANGFDPSLPSRKEPRAHVDMGDHCLIPLGVLGGSGYAIVDKHNAHLDKYQWSKNNAGYAVANIDGGSTLMHHVIIGKPVKPLVTDHINRNKLDNRNVNLRLVTERENALNKFYGNGNA